MVKADIDDDSSSVEKRAMRNALVRFGRAGMRNALVRFGKRGQVDDQSFTTTEDKRNGAPQPFVRFGRSGRVDHINDILSTLQKLEMANA
uniref:Transposase n=1 Tax=Steinernema glaseri TaxID=37863 RepID=A0A1I8A2F8_9BILA